MKPPILLILIGAFLIIIGIIWQLGFPIGKLPGDIMIDKGNFKFYLPITTCILLSIIATVAFLIYKYIMMK